MGENWRSLIGRFICLCFVVTAGVDATECPNSSFVSGTAYGQPAKGCCQWAQPMHVLCDPAGPSDRATSHATQVCLQLGAEVTELGTRQASCAGHCDRDEDCVLWSFEPARHVGLDWRPATCSLMDNELSCVHPTCEMDGAYVGRKDCRQTGLATADSIAAAGPQRNIAAVYPSIAAMPLCEGPSAEPVTAGIMNEGQYMLDAECRHPIWGYDGPAQACLEGSWVVIAGGSNVVMIAAQVVAMLTLNGTALDVKRGMIRSSTIVDIVIEGGVAIHTEYFFLGWGKGQVWQDSPNFFHDALARAPPFATGRTRVTLFVGAFWDNVAMSIDMVEASTAWSQAEVTFVTQIGRWYSNCRIAGNCDRPDVVTASAEATYRRFGDDLTECMPAIERLCGPGGRASVMGCSILSGWVGRTDVLSFTHLMKKAIAASSLAGTPALRFVDYFEIGAAAGSENIQNHASPMVANWFWQIQFGSVCPAVGVPPSDDEAILFEGVTCFASQARSLPSCAGSKYLFMCAHQWLCTVRAWSPLSSDGAVNESSFVCTDGPVVTPPDALDGPADLVVVFNATDSIGIASDLPCRRVWCDEDLVFLPPVLAFVFASLTVGGNYLLQARKGRATGSGLSVSAKASPQYTTLQADVVGAEASPPDGPELETSGAHATPLPDACLENAELVPPKAAQPLEVSGAHTAPLPDPWMQGLRRPASAGDRFPLGPARMLASLHVVAGHLYASGHIGGEYIYGWGFTWVPWFFMLSGFVLFSAEQRRPSKERWWEYVGRRSVTIYPLYAASLLPALAIKAGRGRSTEWWALVTQTWLMQAWVPWVTEQTLQMHCWFLSCMVVYWLCFFPLAKLVKRMDLKKTVCSLMFVSFLPWLSVVVPAAIGNLMWYREHTFGDTQDAVDILVVFVKFHPACYFHIFIQGMLLARLRKLLDEYASFWRYPMEILAPTGYLGLIFIFSIRDARPWSPKISTRLSILSPLQAAILFGIAGLPSLPPPWFAHICSFGDFLSEYSYSVYIFQFICDSLWPSDAPVDFSFFVFLLSTAVIATHCIQKPAVLFWRTKPNLRVCVPILLTLVLPLVNRYLVAEPSSAPLADIPQVIWQAHPDGQPILDVRLPLADAAGGRQMLINPSLLIRNGSVFISARRHSRSFSQYNGEYNGSSATVMEVTWHSEIVFGNASVDLSDLLSWDGNGPMPMQDVELCRWTGLQTMDERPWTNLCVSETWIPENRTLMRQVVSGPEDPKLVDHEDIQIVFSSLPPIGAPPLSEGVGEGMCGRPEDGFELGTVAQMYMGRMGNPVEERQAHRIQCGYTHLSEKNWIPFTKGNGLYFVYKVQPHQVLMARSDGACEQVYMENFVPLQRLLVEQPHLDIRGSGQAVFIDDADVTPNMPRPHYLALTHIVDTRTKQYAHFAYRFSAEPPFEVLQVSSQLPLHKARPDPGATAFAFASGLVVQGRTVAISYGAGDRDARMLVLSLDRLDSFFACCSGDCIPSA